MRCIVDLENFLAYDKILKWIAFSLRNYREKHQKLAGHPRNAEAGARWVWLEPDSGTWSPKSKLGGKAGVLATHSQFHIILSLILLKIASIE